MSAEQKGMDYFLKCAAKLHSKRIFYGAFRSSRNGCGRQTAVVNFFASDMMKYVDNAKVLGLSETMRFMECCEGERMADKLRAVCQETY